MARLGFAVHPEDKEPPAEVIRLGGLIEQGEKRHEEEFAFQFEEAYFCTLGLLYEKHPRFAGGALSPILRRVDRLLKSLLKSAYETREKRSGRIEAADARLKEIVDKLKRRGVNHPFVKNFVLARCNPLGRARKTLPGFDQAVEELIASLEAFDFARIRQEAIA